MAEEVEDPSEEAFEKTLPTGMSRRLVRLATVKKEPLEYVGRTLTVSMFTMSMVRSTCW